MNSLAPLPPAAESAALPRILEAPLPKRTWRDRLLFPRQGNVLGLAWIHGEFHAAVFRHQSPSGTWSSPTPVTTVAELEAALDTALASLKFHHTEVFLILEHENFQHVSEQAPAFSDSATRAFLKSHVARLEQAQEPMLWVSQRTSSQRNEASVLLHLLTGSFYDQLNRLMLARRLELTRIVPLIVPLQLIIDGMADAKEHPVLLATPAGNLTHVVAGRAGAPLLFTRSILAPWDAEPARLAVEFNRSLLYAKQQFSTAIERVRLLGPLSETLQQELRTRCSTAKEVTVVRSAPLDWMLAVARLSSRHPINLVAGYLSYKQRQRMVRRLLIGCCTLALVLTALEAFSRIQNGQAERQRLTALRANAVALEAQRIRLSERNALADTHADIVAESETDRLPPIPARFLSFVAGILPLEVRLSSFTVKVPEEGSGWAVRLEGVIDGDEEIAQEILGGIERQLQRSAFRATFTPQGRATAPVPVTSLEESPRLRFVLEGVLLEN